MIFTELGISGVRLIEIEPIEDERGFFARTACRDEFKKYGINAEFVQQSVSFNKKRGTIRGMHWQEEPYVEDKLVRCTMGKIWDVVVDIRVDSPTYKEWLGVELSALNRRQIYIPKGIAHGFQTLENDSEVFYEMSIPYHPESSRGFRWDDSEIGIEWPMVHGIIVGEKDKILKRHGEI